MSKAYRSNRKVTNEDLIKYNNMGLSLKAIGSILNVHPSTVKIRLDQMGIPTADTRRAFMEDVYSTLTPAARDWLADQVTDGGMTIKQIVSHLIMGACVQNHTAEAIGG